MAKKSSYYQKFKDPRWQKKRLSILERDGFKCQWIYCQSTTSTLHVHHFTYLKNRDPWEYDNSFFTTLCDDCHERVGTVNIKEMIIEHLFSCGINEEFKFFMSFPLIASSMLIADSNIKTISEFYNRFIDSDHACIVLNRYENNGAVE